MILSSLAAARQACLLHIAPGRTARKKSSFSNVTVKPAASFASVTALWLAGKKRWAMAALPLAVLIAFSRMYLCVHFPTDILGGAVLGTACGWLGVWAIKKLEERRTVRPR